MNKILKISLFLTIIVAVVGVGIKIGIEERKRQSSEAFKGEQQVVVDGVSNLDDIVADEEEPEEDDIAKIDEEIPSLPTIGDIEQSEPVISKDPDPVNEANNKESSSEEKPKANLVPEVVVENKTKEEVPQEQKKTEEPIKDNAPAVVQEDKENKTSALANKKEAWWFRRTKDHTQPTTSSSVDYKKYDGYYIHQGASEKIMYLTFDEGYENGYTSKILDVLKENDVTAAFFVTKPYIKSNVSLVKRMKEEGHIVGNHSVAHKSFPDLTDKEVRYEIEETERYFEEMTGYKMDAYFRPPMGEYSERTMSITKELGYKTIFWSIAYKDYDVNNQPGVDYVYNHFFENHHPGAIPLVHAVSSSNTEALDGVIKYLKAEGYRFLSLNELP